LGGAGMKLLLKPWKIFRFVVYFLWQLVLSNLKIAQCVILPNRFMRPGIVAVPLDVKTDFEIFFLANAISLTPGTLTLDVSADRKILYVHSMWIDDVEAFRRDIKNGFEKMIAEIFE